MTAASDYRLDINGLRGIAVLSVILFHLGYLPNGYLGVDIFLVISGYLISRIILTEQAERCFSFRRFYLRRARRILPLSLCTTSVALVAGIWMMLPDDLENLCQSVVATNLFANNILALRTTRNYWDPGNDYKPLMHTWSLGIEEQFYMIYPLFLFFLGRHARCQLMLILLLTCGSFALYISCASEPHRFYLLQYRFFELSAGGLGAALSLEGRALSAIWKLVAVLVLLALLIVDIPIPDSAALVMVVFASLGVVFPGSGQNMLYSTLLENAVLNALGTISFSLYMWHQVGLAFVRYGLLGTIDVAQAALVCSGLLVISALSYAWIEQPFRDVRRTSMCAFLWTVCGLMAASTSLSLAVYARAGVVRDVPELEITSSHAARRMHAQYNERVYQYDKPFDDSGKIKVLVLGNSFARDWVNVLLESSYRDRIQISYVYKWRASEIWRERFQAAQYVFFATAEYADVERMVREIGGDLGKVWNVGPKDFGTNNGVVYNRKRGDGYCNTRVRVSQPMREWNERLKRQWKDYYLDLMGMVCDESGTVPVFTPDCRFISQDCRHLTRAGAANYAELLELEGRFKF